jgi:hypothetical protein
MHSKIPISSGRKRTQGGFLGIGSLIGSIVGAGASETASQDQLQESQNALGFQQQVYGQQQANLAPYLQAGNTSLSSLMADFQNGTFGPGSIPAFTAPTAAQAQATPGYQFQLQQGSQAVAEQAASTGATGGGGEAKALEQYGQGLASTTYQNTFQNALSQYQAALTGQAQNYNQLAGVVQTGLGAATGVNQAGTAAATNVAGLMTGEGNAQAAGAVGVANAVTGGISNAQQNYLIQQYLNGGGLGGNANGPGSQSDLLDIDPNATVTGSMSAG